VKQALRQLFSDFLSAILFLVVYTVSGSLFAAAGIAVAVGLAQLFRLKLTRRRIEPMQWMSLGLVVLLGGATMLTQSPRFMMIKPIIVHFAVATVMLRRGWMLRYLPEIVLRNVPEPTIVGRLCLGGLARGARARQSACADLRLVGCGRIEERIDVRRQSIHPQIRDLGDLADSNRSLRPPYGAVGVAHFGWIGLQQVGADAGQFVAQNPGCARDGASGHHHAARSKGAEAKGADVSVAVAHCNPRRVDAELMRGDLR